MWIKHTNHLSFLIVYTTHWWSIWGWRGPVWFASPGHNSARGKCRRSSQWRPLRQDRAGQSARSPAAQRGSYTRLWDAMGCHGNHGVGHKNRDLMDLIMKCLGGSFEHIWRISFWNLGFEEKFRCEPGNLVPSCPIHLVTHLHILGHQRKHSISASGVTFFGELCSSYPTRMGLLQRQSTRW